MELKEFIQTSLVEISEGIASAKETTNLGYRLGGSPAHEKDNSIARIDFDVAVEVGEKGTTSKDAGVRIKVVKGGVGSEKENSYASTTRIKFSVEKTKNSYQEEDRRENI